MPATISINHLGNAEQKLQNILTQYFNDIKDDWSVKIIGDQANTIWEARVQAPDGRLAGTKEFYGEDGEHTPEAIIKWVSLVMRDEPRINRAGV